MRDFTPEEKELIVNTPILTKKFDITSFSNIDPYRVFGRQSEDYKRIWELYLCDLEELRLAYLETRNELYFKKLVEMLPNSYKVVKL